MSYLESESTVTAHYSRGTTGDILTFDGWDDEARRIARFAVATELRREIEAEVRDEARTDGRIAMEWEAEREYDKVKDRHVGLKKLAAKLRERAASPPTVALLDALDKLIDDLPAKLALDA